ncbi:MAG: hypothetical protein H6858_05365 [Rhodospirillales bacterium]|nr:hypothetical protein [Alphaproteobacteria bacterium]MCB1838870.1 hypothetical protein [Alphaproteobacteria bacterium]MCB9977005.1 hypothetical protein [Rhodospirillales bacterium]
MAKKMPWEVPDMALPTAKDAEAEREKDRAFRDSIEGGCWFSHVGGIDEMEESYARRNRGLSPESPAEDASDPADTPEP